MSPGRVIPPLLVWALALPLGLGALQQEPDDESFLSSIGPQLRQMIASHRGVAGLSIVDPSSGAHFGIRADEPFPSGSLIKLGIMAEVLARIDRGELRLEDRLTFLHVDRAGGSGLLRHLWAPQEVTVWDALFLMIAMSDNSATNLLLEKLPAGSVNGRYAQMGMTGTRWFVPYVGAVPEQSFAPDSVVQFGLGRTSPADMARFLAAIHQEELISPEASRTMVRLLGMQKIRGGLDRLLPSDVRVASKTGSTDRVRHECGIVFGPVRDFVACVMTRDNADGRHTVENEAVLLMGSIARLVFEELNRVVAHDPTLGVDPER